MNDPIDREKMISDVQNGMAFATRFLPAIVKLRNASDHDEGATLTPDEVKGLIEGFKLLKDGRP